MKKSLLIATSAIVGLTAVAVSRENLVVSPALDKSELAKELKDAPALMKSNAKSVPAKVVSPDGQYNFFPILGMPSVPFYMSGLTFTYQDGTKGNLAPFPVPANSTQTYQAVTYVGKKVSTAPTFASFDKFQYDWKYVNFVDGQYNTSTDRTVSLTYPPQIRMGGKVLPGFNMSYETLTDTVEQAPYELVIGGKGLYPLNSSEGFGVYEIGFNTCAMIENMQNQATGQFGSCQESNFGTMGFTNRPDETFTEISENSMLEVLSSAFENATKEKLKSVKTQGIGYSLPYPGSPYLLKKLDLYAWASVEKATQLKVEVFEADANGLMVGEPLYTKLCTIEPTSNTTSRWRVVVSSTFSSKDSEGFDLDYVVVDKPLFVKVSGFLNNDSIKAFGAWGGAYERNYMYGQNLPCTAFNVIDLEGENGTKIENYQYGIDTYAWSSDGENYYRFKNFYVDVEAEYPYLQPSQILIGNTSKEISYASDGNYSIEIPTGTTSAALDILTSSDDADLIVFDFDALPEGVKAKLVGAIEYTQQTAVYNFVELQLEFDETFVNKAFTIPVIYKNLSTNLKFYNGSASVGEIAVDNNAETVYFDLQGRKLTGAPEKGVYLVKEGNKVTKVIR